jgi:N-acyl-L-homoserine lactone synthetase
MEASRVAISRDLARLRRTEPFLTLLRAVMQAAKRAGATHLIGATETSFQRWVVHYGLPFRISGPVAEYHGPVVPSILSLQELDDAILSGDHPALDGFPVGWDPRLWPGQGSFALAPPTAGGATFRS